MSKEQVNLTEHHPSHVMTYDLVTREEMEFLKEISIYTDRYGKEQHRFYVKEGRNGFRINAGSWVGVLELSKMRIQISPKFDRGFSRLVEMLCFLHEIPFNDCRDTTGELGASEFVEFLAQTFITEIDKLLQNGIVKEYVTFEENLTQLRGRPDFIINQRINFATPTRMYCQFDELLTDVPENQVIRSALEVLIRLPLLHSTEKSVRFFYSEFEEICESFLGNEWPTFQYNRLNDHYQIIHELAYYIVSHIFLKDFFQDRNQTNFSVLMDMNELFERFAAKLLKGYLPSSNYQVKAGEKYRDAIKKNGIHYQYIEPDLVVFDRVEQNHIVLDVKYKNYGSRKIKNEDVYQLAFYAHSFHHDQRKTCNVQLIFPKFANEISKEEAITLLHNTPHMLTLHTKALDIEYCLELIKRGELTSLTDLAKNLISATVETKVLSLHS